MRAFVLEKATATKLSTGVYRWALSHANTIYRPLVVTVGPVSITTSSDHRNFLIQSDDFTRYMSSLDYFTNENWVSPASIGDHLQHVTARVPSTGVVFTRGATNMIQVVQFGPVASQLFGVTRGTGSWSYALDVPTGNPPFLDTAADIFLFKTYLRKTR